MALKDETLLGIGLISITLGILMGRFVSLEASGFSFSSFASGMLSGVGAALVLYWMLKRRRV